MSDTLKLIVALAAAAVVGLVLGYVVGGAGKGDLEAQMVAAKRQASGAQDEVKRLKARCDDQEKKARRTKLLLLAKEHLLRAQAELFANNYGLASQQMGGARSRLKAVQSLLEGKARERVKQLFEEAGNTQTLVMRLDPMARKFLQDLIDAVHRLPGGR